MSEITAIAITFPPQPVTGVVIERIGPPGADGKSTYQSYLETTTDDPPMTESEWSAGGGGGSVSWASVTGKPTEFNPSAHTHAWDGVTGKPTEFNPSAHSHSWDSITGKPSEFNPTTHTHSWETITGKPNEFNPTSHTHAWDGITGKPTEFNPSAHSHSWDSVTGKPSTFTPEAHTHDDRYYTDTETDILLATKQATLASGTNIKTVNGQSILGSGDLTVSASKSPQKFVAIECDFISANTTYLTALGFVNIGTIASGAVALVAGSADHPGAIQISDSTSANSGWRAITELTAFLITGGEESFFSFRPDDARTTNNIRLGFQDSNTATDPSDGVFLRMVGNGSGGVTATGVCRSNSSESTTGTTVTLTVGTWYNISIVVNSNATLVTYTIKDTAGTTVWTSTVATNIPTGSGRQTGWGQSATESTADAGAPIVTIDYCKLEFTRTLTR